jgi:uncharacterized damage-inducible protein DinB
MAAPLKQSECRILDMSSVEEVSRESRRRQLEEKLRNIEERLYSEMLARGFDPAQSENLALTGPLARLYTERLNLRTELDALASSEHSGSRKVKSSMTEIERIKDQLKRAFEGEAWHGPAVLEILDGITSEQAATQPLNGGHSIWEITLHIAAWLRACRRRLNGDRAQLTGLADWPLVTSPDARAWEETTEAVKQAFDELHEAIANLDDARLDQPILDGMSSIYVTLHGVIQHSLYHAGQIAILKKAFAGRP